MGNEELHSLLERERWFNEDSRRLAEAALAEVESAIECFDFHRAKLRTALGKLKRDPDEKRATEDRDHGTSEKEDIENAKRAFKALHKSRCKLATRYCRNLLLAAAERVGADDRLGERHACAQQRLDEALARDLEPYALELRDHMKRS